MHSEDAYWLIVADQFGGGARIKSKLRAMRQLAGFVCFGQSFVSHGDDSFELNPAGIDDYLKLFRELERRAPKSINSRPSWKSYPRRRGDSIRCAHPTSASAFIVLHIAQAIGERDISVPIKIGIVSNRIHEVTGENARIPQWQPC
jgi:hypothetical protein